MSNRKRILSVKTQMRHSSSGRTKATKVCSTDGCEKPSYCRALCMTHYSIFSKMTREEREAELLKPKPELPKWQYENPVGEAELAKRAAQEKQIE
jgi:hypothetical protein